MTTLYTVQCNFSRPDLEAEWNAWYSGPKTAHMMAKPQFLRSQRFRAHLFDTDIAYVALWELESADALQTPEYRATWGWDKWATMIVDWVRDLSLAQDPDCRVPFADGEIGDTYAHVAWFDESLDSTFRRGLDERCIDSSSWWWGSCDGLDDSARTIAVRTYPTAAQVPADRTFIASARRETVYRSISGVVQAGASDQVLSS